MAISLNNHETRIKALENSGLGSAYSGQGWCNLPGGLQLRFGKSRTVSGISESIWDVTLEKPFTHAGLYAYACFYPDNDHATCDNIGFCRIVSTSVVKVGSGYVNTGYTNGKVTWLAIGYLISDRILKYAYACKSLLFTPLRTIGGVK